MNGYRRWLPAAVAAVVVAGLLVLAGTSSTVRQTTVALDDGAAWLVSSSVGQVSLVDGASARVITQVAVSRAGLPAGTLTAAQSGADAYVLDRSTGTVGRVDGATYQWSHQAGLLTPGSAGALFPGGASDPGSAEMYLVDDRSGLVTSVDPRTLAVSDSQAVATRVQPGNGIVDSAGRLWLIDSSSGDLVSLDAGQRNVVPHAVDPARSVLLLVDGHAAVVDLRSRRVLLIGASGQFGASSCLDLRAGDASAQIAGSPTSPRVYAASGSRGQLLITDVRRRRCTAAVRLDAAGPDLGQPLEAGGRVFVPDFTKGTVHVVDLAAQHEVATPRVLTPGTRFTLQLQGGFVFYNNPAGDQAGVIRLNGSTSQVHKYDPALAGRGGRSGNAATVSTPAPDEPNPRPSTGTTTPAQVQISAATAQVGVGTPLGLQVIATRGGTVVAATWTFDDGGAATGLRTSHAWSVAGIHLVSVSATFADRRIARATTQITVVPAGQAVLVPPPVTVPSPATSPTTSASPAPVPRTVPRRVVEPTPPAAHLVVTPPGGAGPLTVQADASASVAGSKPITSYSFTFGDGSATTTGAAAGTTHVYTSPGTYTLTVTVGDSGGLTSSTSVPVTVTAAQPPPPPTAKVTLSEPTTAPARVVADASASAAGGSPIATYTFVFTDGTGTGPGTGTGTTVGPQSGSTATVPVKAAGTYSVTVTVRDSASPPATSTATASLVVAAPAAGLSVTPPTGAAPLLVTADASTSAPGSTPIATYAFDFGDGFTTPAQAGTTATHTYPAAFSGIVTVKVTDLDGLTATGTAQVKVTGTPGIATAKTPVSGSSPPQYSIQITDTGTAPLNISAITGTTDGACATSTIQPNATCTFIATNADAESATVTITSDAPGSPTTIDLNGP